MTPTCKIPKILLLATLPVLGIVGGALAAGGLMRKMFGNERQDVDFAISPHGDQIVFSAKGEGSNDLYRLHLNDLRVERVTKSSDNERSPIFSPDGKQILFTASKTEGGSARLFVCALDGTGRKPLTPNASVYDSLPGYSADGSQIVFARAARHRPYSLGGWTWDNWDLYVMKSDGTGVRHITQSAYYQVNSPRFSPDGKHILFAAYVDEKTSVYTVDLSTGKPPKQLTQDRSSSAPAYSPDGKHIVFISDRAKPFDYEVWQMNHDGSKPVQITHNGSYNVGPRLYAGRKAYPLSVRSAQGIAP